MATKQVVWRVDGHSISLRVEEMDVKVICNPCPHEDQTDSPCYTTAINGCGVKYLIDVYGLELNVGECEAEPVLEIAWHSEGWTAWDIFATNLKFIPLKDNDFTKWKLAQEQLAAEKQKK